MNLLWILALITLAIMTMFSLTTWISGTTVKELIRNKSNIERNTVEDRNGTDMTKPYEWEVKVSNTKERTNNILLNVWNWWDVTILLQDEKGERITSPIVFQISFSKNVETLNWPEKILEVQRMLLNRWSHPVWNTFNMDTEMLKMDISWISGTTNNGEIHLSWNNYSANIFLDKSVFYTIDKEDWVIIENLKGLNMEHTNTGSEMKDFYHWNNYFINM